MFTLKRVSVFLILTGLLLSIKTVNAQEEIFSLGMQLGSGARAIGMGGAFTSIGGDYSASLWNPAALRDIQRTEIYGSLSHLVRKNNFGLIDNTAYFDPVSQENEEGFTKFNDIGVAYAVPTVQGSLVVAFGFNRIRTYDSNLDFRTFNYSEDDQTEQIWRDTETGGLNAWTIAGAVDVSPNASLGLGLNFWKGHSELESIFRETDINNVYVNEDGTDFHSLAFENNLINDMSGFNVKMGGLFRISPLLRLGLTASTPVIFKVEEDQFFNEEVVYDDGFSESDPVDGYGEYKIQSPWIFSAGASLHLLNFVFAGDVEYADWAQIKYKTDPPFADIDGTFYTKSEANEDIRTNYKATTNIRLGSEFTFPLTGLTFRAGYYKAPSVYQNADPDENKQFLSAGLGFLLDKQVRLDIAFVHGFWKSYNSGLSIPASYLLGELNDPPDFSRTNEVGQNVEDIKVNKIFLSVAFRL